MPGHNLSRARPILPGTSLPAYGPRPAARIHPVTRGVQSAPGRSRWVLEFEPSAPPALDPLTGWTTSTDPLSQVRIPFPDMQSAIAFAESKGWRYLVSEPPRRATRLKASAPHAAHWPFRAIEPASTPSAEPRDADPSDPIEDGAAGDLSRPRSAGVDAGHAPPSVQAAAPSRLAPRTPSKMNCTAKVASRTPARRAITLDPVVLSTRFSTSVKIMPR